mgnify:FL=1
MQNQGQKGPDLDDPGTFFPGGYMPEKSRDMSADVTPLTIAGIPPGGMMGFTEDELYRRKALQDIINDPATDARTLRNAQRQWIQMQKGRV